MTSPLTLMRRSHSPWVDGCWGPMLIHISAILPPLPRLPEFVVLAQRVADPVVGQQHAAQVGVARELHAHEVELLALEPVGAAPHEGGGGHLGVEPVAVRGGLERDVVAVAEEE